MTKSLHNETDLEYGKSTDFSIKSDKKLSNDDWDAIKPLYITVFIESFSLGITIPVFSYFLLDLKGSTFSIGLCLRYYLKKDSICIIVQ